MPQEVDHCPLCGHETRAPFDRRTFRGQLVLNHLCARCGLVYQSPRMDEQELDSFYRQSYRELYQGEAGPSRADLAVQSGRAEALLRFARAHGTAPTRHLDLGCSSGALLQRFRDQFQCASVGVEPGQAYRAHAEAQGLQVYADLQALAEGEREPFDLISLAHVLEHLPEPVPYLHRLRLDHLAPDGWLLVEVPNLYAHNSFEVAHLVSFSPHTLRETLHQAGFRLGALQAHGQPRSVTLPLYLAALARAAHPPEQRAPRPERLVRLKRRAGMLRRRLLQRLFPELAWLPLP